MKVGPDIALVASLVGDPARANMLAALMSGRALTAGELAHEAGVTPQTASSHLAKLEDGALIVPEKQGRHRYFRLSGEDVAVVLEALMGLAARAGHLRTQAGPKDPALRRARVCYDHLAGDLGVELYDCLRRQRLIADGQGKLQPTPKGERLLADFGIDLPAMRGGRRPLCKTCLDWSARRDHLAGALGAALLSRLYELKWARREPATRIVTFSRAGEKQFRARFGLGEEQAV
jgi:DNA-binding transcriptional ArsR family regulator